MRAPSTNPKPRASGVEAPHHGKVYACLALLILLTFAVDVSFRLVAFGGFYAIPILISLWLRNFRVTLGLTVLCCVLTVGEVALVQSRGLAIEALGPFTIQQLIGNHAVEVSSLVVVCLIGYWRLRDERELEESRATTATTLSSIAEGVITLDADRRVTYLNPQAEQMTGVPLDQALAQPVDAVLRLSDEKSLHVPIEDLPGDEGPRTSRAMLIPKRGAQVRIELVNSPLRGPMGHRRGEVIVFRDITERERLERDMRTLAYRDTLTNLPNRLSLHELLSLELAHARRNQGSLAVLFLDLDDFKRVNDTHGHAAGDELLRATAARLRANLRETDTVARLGGDEFAIVLSGAENVHDVELVVAKLLGAVEEPVQFDGREIRTRASIGLALFPKDGMEADELLRRADEAMYRAKQLGGGRLMSTGGS